MATKRCPVCDVPVKPENLERHIRNQHPRAQVNPESLLTPEERRRATQTRAGRPVLTRQGRRIILIVAVVLAVVLVLVIANPFRAVGPAVGQIAPDFSVRTSSGGSLTLSSLRGNVVLLEFMDVDCPACQHEAPTLVWLYANFSATVRFVSIDVNFVSGADDDARLNTFKTTYGTSWTYALDTTRGITNAYGVDSTPTTFILDRNGVVAAIFHPPDNTYAGYAAALNRAVGG